MAVKGGTMKDLIITIDCDSRKVNFNRDFIGLTGENLQGNIVVDFTNKADFVDGEAMLEVEQNGKPYSIKMTKDDTNKVYTLPIKSSLLRYACTMKCQVVITQEETADGTPTFKTVIFNLPCYEAINATEIIPDQYPTWTGEIEARLEALEKGGVGATYQLIETITAEVGNISRTEDTNGNPYQFKALLIRFADKKDKLAVSTSSVYVKTYGTGANSNQSHNRTITNIPFAKKESGKGRYLWAETYINRGVWTAISSAKWEDYASSGSLNFGYEQFAFGGVTESIVPLITKLEIIDAPIGITIEIWGAKINENKR